MSSLECDALKYDLSSLVDLQKKRNENISLFEQAIKNERIALQQEETIQFTLEQKLYNLKIDETEKEWILSDLPKIKTTCEKRNSTIMLLKAAIVEEYEKIDYEFKMITFLQIKNKNGSKD